VSTRLLHIVVPTARLGEAEAAVAASALERWHVPVDGAREHLTVALAETDIDRVVDALEASLGTAPGFAVIVAPVEALLGAGVAPKAPPPAAPPTRLERFFSRNRLSTEELYDDIEGGTELTATFVVFVVTSAVIAALGMRTGQTAVVIGAMVIAPFLSPAMAMAMAATVGDRRLGLRALGTTLAGMAVAFVATVALGAVVRVDPTVPELAARTVVSPADIGLALASGVAGVIAFCRGLSASLVGVMIAVALVPPLAAAGLLVGSGHEALAVGALLLFATNLVSINVAGIGTFLFQGLPPKDWRLTGRLLVMWVALLAALAYLIVSRTGG
jgi:uncharacterized hydrophobic protein (TIGR00341 family)